MYRLVSFSSCSGLEIYAGVQVTTGDAVMCGKCRGLGDVKMAPRKSESRDCRLSMVAPPPTLSDEAKADEQAAEAADKQIIFCVDVSGSMCVSQQIDAKHNHFKLRDAAERGPRRADPAI